MQAINLRFTITCSRYALLRAHEPFFGGTKAGIPSIYKNRRIDTYAHMHAHACALTNAQTERVREGRSESV